MRLVCLSLLFFGICITARAQSLSAQSETRGAWELEPFIGGGTGLGKASNTQFLIAGGRVGKILTGEHFSGFLRGNFELATEAMPLYLVMQPGGAVYGASFKPLIFKWNFASGHKSRAVCVDYWRRFFHLFQCATGKYFQCEFYAAGRAGILFFPPSETRVGFRDSSGTHFECEPRTFESGAERLAHFHAGL